MTGDRAKAIGVPGTDLQVSRLGYGTSRLHTVASARERRALLELAADAGLTHIDTAPLYGFGLAEREIGTTLAAEPSVTIATKVGLYAPGGPDRAWLGTTLRKGAGRLFPVFSRAVADFTVLRAEESLTESLRRLKRERVDFLLVHEPEFGLMQIDEWQSWLARERERGRVRLSGLAGSTDRLSPFAGISGPLAGVWQAPDDGEPGARVRQDDRDPPFRVVYGVLSGGPRRAGPRSAGDAIADALDRVRHGTVLVSTRRRERLEAFGAALDRYYEGRRNAE